MNADALAGGIGAILSHNVFAYCGNNPVTKYDPDVFRGHLIDGARTPRSRTAPKNTLSAAAATRPASASAPRNNFSRPAIRQSVGPATVSQAQVQEAHIMVADSYKATKTIAQEWGLDWGLKKELGYKKGYLGASGGVILSDDNYGIYATGQYAIVGIVLGVSKRDSFYFHLNCGLEAQAGPAYISLDLLTMSSKIDEYYPDTTGISFINKRFLY